MFDNEHNSSYGIITSTKVPDILSYSQQATILFSPMTLLGARMIINVSTSFFFKATPIC